MPTYDGVRDIDDFIREFKYESEMYGWDQEAQARVIKLCLKGQALVVYNSLDSSQKANVEEVEKALRAQCVLRPEVYLNNFSRGHRNQGKA